MGSNYTDCVFNYINVYPMRFTHFIYGMDEVDIFLHSF